MRLTRSSCLRWAAVIGAIVALPAGAVAADSPWLYGIHWFGPASNASDVSQMTGGKSIWDLETVMTNDGAGDCPSHCPICMEPGGNGLLPPCETAVSSGLRFAPGLHLQ